MDSRMLKSRHSACSHTSSRPNFDLLGLEVEPRPPANCIHSPSLIGELDPLSEPCSGPTQSTPQLVLYLMEGCYELAGSGTTRDTLMTT
ncbi:hypothetical protein ASPBRDRAFT_356067 [Aspergillus brasiliensis CBS 101740]|uniref:Uncharacterized protein n=1 Tax=Aspergillus brasiliensis (strain CBS 101740 / IMI 381727 / IBT 21946) TaxID=767769 RepID=A0A1L9U5S3_ASPBC|nr:hypothetical protein ASPBRDRAFT_356067 [Aspergillus brasiliensis CBS 101740]